ncbi:hypothetical protein [Brachybacterium aquaticum]|uniref:Uncharacterized protein n=1 Tax=Brachybacterium aquaticum TaxID=1432564 RepID=A0A841AGI2_9MICO|nr:hypothetical protein [Brachybacterium aquaticum]MBB5832390.1 hypothetical protein [Brachybacterium aquaticum]
MFLGSLIPLLMLLLIPLLVVVAVLLIADALGHERTGLHRGALIARWIGVPLGMIVTVAVVTWAQTVSAGSEHFATGAFAAAGPFLGGIVLVLAIAMGEMSLPAPRTAVRRASLQRRTAGSIVPRGALVLAGLALAALALVTATGALLASGGNTFMVVEGVGDDGVPWGAVYGPFPGWHYTVVIAVGTVALLLVALLALRLILRRRPSDDPQDILLRRRSSTSVAGAVVLAAAACTLPVSVFLLHPLVLVRGLYEITPAMQAGTAIAGIGILAALLALPVGLVMVVFPQTIARRAPRRRPSAAPGAGVAGVEGVAR